MLERGLQVVLPGWDYKHGDVWLIGVCLEENNLNRLQKVSSWETTELTEALEW